MLGHIERELGKRGRKDLVQEIAKVRSSLEKDIPFPVPEEVLALEQTTEEYKKDPNNPELLTQFMDSFWKAAGERINEKYVVSDFPLESEEIKKRRKKGQMAIFIPERKFVPEKNYAIDKEMSQLYLARMFPKMRSWLDLHDPHTPEGDAFHKGGWFWIESSVDSPNMDYDIPLYELTEKFKKVGFRGQTLKIYIVGGQISKLLTGEYFDERSTWSYLPDRGSFPWARFTPDGDLHLSRAPDALSDDFPSRVHPRTGFRFFQKID